MSRLWSRFGVRSLSVALLVVAVTGGMYLGKNRETQQRGIEAGTAAVAEQVDQQMFRDYAAARTVATSRQRAAEREARRKALAAAKAAAERARLADEAASRKKSESNRRPAPTPVFPGPIPASCNEFSGNRKTGCALTLRAGFKIDQFACLNALWDKESGWNHRAQNSSSGAYGIPQALPGSKMVSAGADWKTNPATQIEWGLGYIKGRYGSPCDAWSHSKRVGWY
ncbi:MAG TPA: lytic transglycosylase domain-containing protein [Pilimelia sp.]|nr:lytic transglycosylase domain-containing protein [Pilimelia sp.]